MTRRTSRSVVALLGLAALLATSDCARRRLPRSPDEPSPTFTGTSYFQEGDDLFLAVDMRAAMLGGTKDGYLPLLVAVVNKTGDFWELTRESFAVELPDGRLLPVASYEEWEDDYGRDRTDLRIGDAFLASLRSNYPEPPYSWIELEMFPPRASGAFPRDDLQIRKAQLAWGYLYFPVPEDLPAGGERWELLFRPDGARETYSVDFAPSRERGS